MDENVLNEILSSYRDAINALIERMDAQDEMVKATIEKVDGLNHLIFDEVINPAKEAMDHEIYNEGLESFSGRWGEKLAGFNDKLRPIEGKDFDIVKQAYDGFNSIEGEKPEEEEYVNKLVAVVEEQLEEIRTALGIPQDAEITVSNEDGETKVEVEGEELSPETEAKPEAETEDESEVTGEEGEEVTDPEELAALEEELRKLAK